MSDEYPEPEDMEPFYVMKFIPVDNEWTPPSGPLLDLTQLYARAAAEAAKQLRADALGNECCAWIERVGGRHR